MADDICSDENCEYNVPEISRHEQAALDAISAGIGMGEMLRSLPEDTPKHELQKFANA